MSKTLTAENIISEMKLGWNLGNTLDAPHGETTWGNPVTTREMIAKIKELGFNTVRLPVSWHCHIGSHPSYKIDIPWLDRVQEIVDWILEEGMFCIINSHHDDVMYIPHDDYADKATAYLTGIWGQLCERFKDYGDRLIFEAMNEPRELKTKNEWHLEAGDPHCEELARNINRYNQVFVDTVRASEHENNRNRFLMTPSYDAAPLHATPDFFVMPTDPMNRTILSIHAYTPYNLCLNMDSDVDVLTEETKKDIDWFMINIHKKFISKGIPVFIGETAILDKNNPEVRCEWCKYFFGLAKKYGMACALWDTGSGPMKLLNRHTVEMFESDKPLLKGIFEGLESDIEGVLQYR